MTLADDLKAARALIDTPEKWGQGPHRRPCRCAGDAVTDVAFGDQPWSPRNERENAMAEALMGPGGVPIFRLIDLNDDEATTHNDILALFDRAINAADTITHEREIV